MSRFANDGFTKFETLLGVSVVLIIGLAAVPVLQRHQDLGSPARAVQSAEEIAHAVLDYRTDTGQWPTDAAGQVDLAQLTDQRPADNSRAHDRNHARDVARAGAESAYLIGTMADVGSADTAPEIGSETGLSAWLDEVPLDPWQRPYRVVVLGEPDTRSDWAAAANGAGYPDAPPPGVAIVVISAGSNGLWETDVVQLWDSDLAQRLGREHRNDTPLRGDVFSGDDLGFVLSRHDIGESP